MCEGFNHFSGNLHHYNNTIIITSIIIDRIITSFSLSACAQAKGRRLQNFAHQFSLQYTSSAIMFLLYGERVPIVYLYTKANTSSLPPSLSQAYRLNINTHGLHARLLSPFAKVPCNLNLELDTAGNLIVLCSSNNVKQLHCICCLPDLKTFNLKFKIVLYNISMNLVLLK